MGSKKAKCGGLEAAWLKPSEIAQELRVARSTPYEWIAAGILPAYRFSKHVIRVKRDDFEAFLVSKASGMPLRGSGNGSSSEELGSNTAGSSGRNGDILTTEAEKGA